MENDNIIKFNLMSMMLLNYLYDNFPEPVDIDTLRFMIETIYESKEKGEDSDFVKYLVPTLDWLDEEKFIRFSRSKTIRIRMLS